MGTLHRGSLWRWLAVFRDTLSTIPHIAISQNTAIFIPVAVRTSNLAWPLCPDQLWGPPRGVLSQGVKHSQAVTLTTHPLYCQGQEWVGATPLCLVMCMAVAGQLYFLYTSVIITVYVSQILYLSFAFLTSLVTPLLQIRICYSYSQSTIWTLLCINTVGNKLSTASLCYQWFSG
jgi:hypothetical protein